MTVPKTSSVAHFGPRLQPECTTLQDNGHYVTAGVWLAPYPLHGLHAADALVRGLR